MHTLRIRVKRLRYAIELLFAAGEATDKALKAAQKLQKRLGELHDVDEAQVRMGRARGLPTQTREAVGRELVRLRASVARKAVRELANLVPALEREVASLLRPPAPC
jgi:CHAD domain-containing protein